MSDKISRGVRRGGGGFKVGVKEGIYKVGQPTRSPWLHGCAAHLGRPS